MDNDYIKVNKNTYNEVAKDLMNRHKTVGKNEPRAEDYYDKIFKHIDFKDNIKYLELGPGDGNIIKYFASKNIDTYAIENSEEMIKLCKMNSPKTKIIDENVFDVNLESNTFDVVFAGSFVHLFPTKDANVVMKKVYDWLKDGGIFFAYTTLHDKDEEGYFSKTKSIYPNENKRFRHRYTEESLFKLFTDNGFSVLEHYKISEPENDKIWQFVLAKK